MKEWEGILLADGQRVVYPIDDSRGHHITNEKCWCNPTIDQGGDAEILVHRSADRREAYEGTKN